MKLKHLLLITVGSCGITSFATANNTPKLLAIPSDTNSVTFYVCNFTNSVGTWSMNTPIGQENVVLDAPLLQDAGNCSTMSIRGKTEPGVATPEIRALNLIFKQNGNTISSARLSNLNALPNPFNGSITKTFDVTSVTGSLLHVYSNGGLRELTVNTNTYSYKNLSGDVVPDYVICAGSDTTQCNDYSIKY